MSTILFTEANYDVNNDWQNGTSHEIQEVNTKSLIDKIKANYYPPHNDIKLKVTDADIQDWMRMVKRKVEDIDFNDVKYLQIAFIKHEDGFDEFELEYQTEAA